MPLPPSQPLSALADRPHWTVANGRATFAPVPSGWRAIVRRLRQPVDQARFHVAVLDRSGAVRYVSETASLDEAVRNAERGVLTRNALRLLRPA